LVKRLTFNAKMKYRCYHFVSDMVDDGRVMLENVDTLVNVVDVLMNLVST